MTFFSEISAELLAEEEGGDYTLIPSLTVILTHTFIPFPHIHAPVGTGLLLRPVSSYERCLLKHLCVPLQLRHGPGPKGTILVQVRDAIDKDADADAWVPATLAELLHMDRGGDGSSSSSSRGMWARSLEQLPPYWPMVKAHLKRLPIPIMERAVASLLVSVRNVTPAVRCHCTSLHETPHICSHTHSLTHSLTRSLRLLGDYCWQMNVFTLTEVAAAVAVMLVPVQVLVLVLMLRRHLEKKWCSP